MPNFLSGITDYLFSGGATEKDKSAEKHPVCLYLLSFISMIFVLSASTRLI